MTDVSADGKWGAWLRLPARTKGTVLVVDIETGKEKVVYPPSGDVGIQDAAFSHDGKRLYVATDGGGDQALLLSFDTKTLKEVGRWAETKPATAMVTHLVTLEKGKPRRTQCLGWQPKRSPCPRRRDPEAQSRGQAAARIGLIHEFSEDGKRLTLDRSTPEAPTDAHVLEVATGVLAPLRKESRPSIQELATVETQLVEIPAHDGLKIPTNVYLPAPGRLAQGPAHRARGSARPGRCARRRRGSPRWRASRCRRGWPGS